VVLDIAVPVDLGGLLVGLSTALDLLFLVGRDHLFEAGHGHLDAIGAVGPTALDHLAHILQHRVFQ